MEAFRLAATTAEWTRFGVIVGAGLIAGQLIAMGMAGYAARGDSDPRGARSLGRLARVIVIGAAVIYGVAQLGVRITPLLTAAGIGGVALALSVRTIFENFLAGILLLVRRPFRPGDQIASGDFEGTVEDVNLRTVVLRTFDGERVHLPNGSVLSSAIVNRSAFLSRRTSLDVGLAYDADLDEAVAVIEAAVARVEGVRDDPPPEALAHCFGESTIQVCVRFWHDAPQLTMWRVRHRVAVAIKAALDDAGIEMPFPMIDLKIVDRSER